MDATPDNLLTNLNAQQVQGVLHTDGPLLIVAGAGSGKTTVLTRRAARLIRDGVPARKILIVTFTNKAAAELRERLVDLIGDEGSNVVAATFHSFCLNHIIRPFGYAIGLDNPCVIDDHDQAQLIRSAIESLSPMEQQWMREYSIKPRDIRSEMGLARAFGQTPEDYLRQSDSRDPDYPLHAVTASVWKEYLRMLEKNRAVDFDGILERALEILRTHPPALDRLRGRFHQLMVDEFQDTNMVQAELIRLMSNPRDNLTVVGDARQSIYRFRGSDISVILGFQRDYPGAGVLELPINYRSTGPIVEVANHVSGTMRQKVGELEMEAGGQLASLQHPPTYSEHASGREEADALASAIQILHEDGARLEDIAVLYRSRAIKNTLEAALIAADIPYRVVGDMGYFQKKEIRDLMALLRVILNRTDGMAWLRMIEAVRPGLSPAGLKNLAKQEHISLWEALQKKAKGNGKVAARLKSLIHETEQLRLELNGQSPNTGKLQQAWREWLRPALIKTVNTQLKSGSLELRQKAIESRTASVNQLFSLLEDKLPSSSFEEVMENLLLLADSPEDSVDSEQGRVLLMTVHASKGLEFNHVFLPGMEDGLFPIRMDSPEEFEEELRIFYVALTRAKSSLHFSWAWQRVLHGSAKQMDVSPFLELIGDQLHQRIAC